MKIWWDTAQGKFFLVALVTKVKGGWIVRMADGLLVGPLPEYVLRDE